MKRGLKYFVLAVMMTVLGNGAFGQLNPGDIAIIQYNSDGTDNIAFLALTDITAGEVIYFTDNGWLSTNAWRNNEGVHTYTAPAGGVSCGDIVTVILTGPAVSASGDQIIAYQNASDMIFGINNEGAHIWQPDAIDAATSALPQGLVNGSTAVALDEIDNAIYNGPTTGTKAQLLSWICDYTNWIGDNSINQTFSGSFTITDCGAATPLLVANPSTLTGLDYIFGSGPSGQQTYDLSGTNLTPASGNITITPPANFEISFDNVTYYTTAQTVAYNASTLSSTAIYVRLVSGLAVGTYGPSNITNAGGGATTVNVSLEGEVTAVSAGGCASDLIISEYVEGSSNNKYIEIYNGTGASVDLTDYELHLYANGSGTVSNNDPLTGTLADGAVRVYQNSSAVIYSGDENSVACLFNGDDAIGLYKVSTTSYVDIFGCIGEDPGSAWTSGSHSTVDKTLVRKSTVTSGITTNPATGFPTIATEWDVYNQDDVSFLGSHTMTCASNTITTGTVSTSPFSVDCTTGDGGSVAFTSTDPFTSNTYTAQLSDASGSFASPVNIGILVSDANSGTINFVIPPATPTGSGYLIRVVSSSPAVVGTTSAAFTINLTGGPCSCFEIESILVDACEDIGWEGENEMFRFSVGGNPIDVNDITVTWPNNPWLGLCQNATTASIVSAINATITGGGSLVEPPGGIIPAGAEVMFFTSTDFNYTQFDFSTLNYTLYAIFQCAGNTAGHFVNHTSPGPVLRTLDMDVSGCGSDDVTYDADLVFNGDGGTVDFDIPGNPTYSATGGCSTVPIFPVPVELTTFNASCSNNDVLLTWSTATETNNDYFTVEGALNTIDFVPITRVNGAGNTNMETRYSVFVDSDYRYFRLKQTDFDGAYTYSPLRFIDCGDNGFELYPTLISTGEPVYIKGDVHELSIFNVLGQQAHFDLNENIITGLSEGLYFVVINETHQYKLIVK
ncbi:MAG: lamin tail domain-containing protein [Bacteroidales bacterium]|nr:lamin tail domain-containing protein [Bacteroidales bacterium]